ncbi:MAG: dihydropteroate synthase [Candidatus Helarchaeota archaeon]
MITINTKIINLRVGDSYPVRTVGIINLSKESFYKSSIVTSKNLSKQVELMVDEGAEILDIGARSTAPGVAPISIEEEKKRLIPALKKVLDMTNCIISIDTQYSTIADNALSIGAHIINDISGFQTDPNMVKVISNHDCPVILMATNKIPGDCCTISEIFHALKNSIDTAIKNEIDDKNIIIDPGVGRWIDSKTYEYNLDILNNLESFRSLKKIILVGISRKSFIGDVLNIPNPSDRLNGSLASTVIAVYNGAHIIRTHDVKAQIEMVKMAKTLRDRKLGKI